MGLWYLNLLDELKFNGEAPPIKFLKEVADDFNAAYQKHGLEMLFELSGFNHVIIDLRIKAPALRYRTLFVTCTYDPLDYKKVFINEPRLMFERKVKRSQLEKEINKLIQSKYTSNLLKQLQLHVECLKDEI